MLNVDTATRADLEVAILEDDALLACFDATRLYASAYSTEELRAIVVAYVEAGDECQGC